MTSLGSAALTAANGTIFVSSDGDGGHDWLKSIEKIVLTNGRGSMQDRLMVKELIEAQLKYFVDGNTQFLTIDAGSGYDWVDTTLSSGKRWYVNLKDLNHQVLKEVISGNGPRENNLVFSDLQVNLKNFDDVKASSAAHWFVGKERVGPVVGADPLDLNGNGIELTSLRFSSPYFNIDGGSKKEQIGWVTGGDGLLARAAKPFAASGAVIAETVRQSPVIASDETSARVCGKTHWQSTFAAASAVYHTIAPARGKVVPVEFLGGARPKVWLSDRLAAQCKHAGAHQYCLAHLIRDAQSAIDAGDTIFAPAFKRLLQKACAIGRRRPDLADATIKTYARDLSRELDRLLDLEPTQKDGSHLRASMQVDARDTLLVFLTRRDIEPTNNVSERALRPSVIFRKVTNGFRSGWGANVYADICSMVATGRLAGRNPLAAIREALAAPA